MAVAMRFAVVDVMYQGDENVSSALFLDDLLISLDMSTRLSVIDVILAYQDKYQILLFTHDYAFYDILKSRIGDMGKRETGCSERCIERMRRWHLYRPL